MKEIDLSKLNKKCKKECARLYNEEGVWIEEGCNCGCWGDDPCYRIHCPHCSDTMKKMAGN